MIKHDHRPIIFCPAVHGIASMRGKRTKMVTAIANDVLPAKLLPQIPIARHGKIIYLCSEEAGLCYRRQCRIERRPAHAVAGKV